MAHITADRVKETSTTTGTGSYTLAGAATGFRAFSAVCATNDTVYYAAADQSGAGWEIGLGTLTASTTLARTTIIASSNSGSAVNWSAGTRYIFLSFPANAGGVNVQDFTSTGNSTWTKPLGCRFVTAILVGGGGGGGSGRRAATTTARGGGGGGESGGTTVYTFWADDLPATMTVTVGAGGTGGASVTTDTTGGNMGNMGGDTKLINPSTSAEILRAPGGVFGLGGSTTNTGYIWSAVTGGGDSVSGIPGGNGQTLGGSPPSAPPELAIDAASAGPSAGGGGGGALANSTATATGGASNAVAGPFTSIAGAAGGTNGGAGTAGGTALLVGLRKAGLGGGGGSYKTAQATGAGGNGSQPGGGGGGGAASDNGYASGKGGNGGDGWARIVSW